MWKSKTGTESSMTQTLMARERTMPQRTLKIPAANQDVDDLTLGETLTEAYRGQVDYFVQGGVSVSQSVSQSSSSVRFDGSGQPDGEMVDR